MSDQTDILLINRDKYFLSQTAKVLREEGLTIHTALETREALAILSSNPVGVIICDKDLQDVSGYEFLGFIKKDPLREKIPFMFYVSLNDQGRPMPLFQLGAIDYLVYPIDTQALVGRINDAMNLARGAGKPGQNTDPAQKPFQISNKPPVSREKDNSQPLSVSVFHLPLDVEVSRDGVIWLLSKVTRISHQGLTMETAMMGKAGVSLMIRVTQPDGAFILNGVIKDISFNDFQRPAGLEINIAADDNWRRVQAGLPQEYNPSGIIGQIKAAAEQGPNRDVAPPPSIASRSEGSAMVARHKKTNTSEHKEPSYDKRFYQSLVGKQLDNYRAISVIGIGNMGGVLQGWDVALEREVALKIISYNLSSKEAFRELFIKEARVISKLNHPNIAHIYHIGTSNEILYYAMEFVEGITLKEMIKQKGPIELTKGLNYLQTVCDAMEIIYQNSIVHRDIKPANLIISHDGVVKIVDFGVAHSHDASSDKANNEKKGLYGTPLYMSPEQIAGLAIDHRSDMYALGATFYHAFCGVPPFHANDIKGLLRHHLNTPLTPLNERNPTVPQDLSDIIKKMMAKDPFERYKNFRLIKDKLKGIRARET